MWSAQLKQWIRENVGDAGIDVRDGRRVVEYADPVIRVHPGWLADHGLGDVASVDLGDLAQRHETSGG